MSVMRAYMLASVCVCSYAAVFAATRGLFSRRFIACKYTNLIIFQKLSTTYSKQR